jgi:hypothetical protein
LVVSVNIKNILLQKLIFKAEYARKNWTRWTAASCMNWVAAVGCPTANSPTEWAFAKPLLAAREEAGGRGLRRSSGNSRFGRVTNSSQQ